MIITIYKAFKTIFIEAVNKLALLRRNLLTVTMPHTSQKPSRKILYVDLNLKRNI